MRSKDELQALAQAILGGHPFREVQSYYYWSSMNSTTSTGYAWRVNIMSNGFADNYSKTYSFHMWPVRAGQ